MLVDWCATLWPAVEREWDGITRHHATLSETIARTLHTETPAGRVAWTVGLAAGSGWLWWHIVTFGYTAKAGA